MTKNNPVKPIILYDGMCNFCRSSVDFIIHHGKKNSFIFFPFHSDDATKLLTGFVMPENYSESVVLIENRKVFVKSTAALRIAGKLNPPYRWLYIFIIIPRFVRDHVYDWVAGHRYNWQGNVAGCAVPEDSTKLKP